jgi:hypothetical protein
MRGHREDHGLSAHELGRATAREARERHPDSFRWAESCEALDYERSRDELVLSQYGGSRSEILSPSFLYGIALPVVGKSGDLSPPGIWVSCAFQHHLSKEL